VFLFSTMTVPVLTDTLDTYHARDDHFMVIPRRRFMGDSSNGPAGVRLWSPVRRTSVRQLYFGRRAWYAD
jgi:hypothetical protein